MKMKNKESTELPDNSSIYGFAFTDDLSNMDMSEIHESLYYMGRSSEEVVFSVCDDIRSECTWIVAANRYLIEDEVADVIDFIIDNNLSEEYCLINYSLET
jgi:hypothetical protein